MAIGELRCHVIDVGDLAIAEEFWSEVTGLPVITSGYNGRFSYLGQPKPWKHEVILQLREGAKSETPNRSHVDITPANGIDDAIVRIIAAGGSVRKTPSIYPRPGTFEGKRPVIDWAVMRDPFGNEFCLVDDLTRQQSRAVEDAAAAGVVDDHGLRVAAGVTA